MKTIEQTRKEDILNRLRILISETEKILSQPQFFSKKARMNAGIKAFTKECSICDYKNLTGCKGCVYGLKKSCLNMFWHPQIEEKTERKDFAKALEFLNYLFPLLVSLPEFVFGPNYVDCLRAYIEEIDKLFMKEYLGIKEPKKKKASLARAHVIDSDI